MRIVAKTDGGTHNLSGVVNAFSHAEAAKGSETQSSTCVPCSRARFAPKPTTTPKSFMSKAMPAPRSVIVLPSQTVARPPLKGNDDTPATCPELLIANATLSMGARYVVEPPDQSVARDGLPKVDPLPAPHH